MDSTVYSDVSTSTRPHLTVTLPSFTVTSALARSNLSIPHEIFCPTVPVVLYPFLNVTVTLLIFPVVAFTKSFVQNHPDIVPLDA